jgi:hypothetical protein
MRLIPDEEFFGTPGRDWERRWVSVACEHRMNFSTHVLKSLWKRMPSRA